MSNQPYVVVIERKNTFLLTIISLFLFCIMGLLTLIAGVEVVKLVGIDVAREYAERARIALLDKLEDLRDGTVAYAEEAPRFIFAIGSDREVVMHELPESVIKLIEHPELHQGTETITGATDLPYFSFKEVEKMESYVISKPVNVWVQPLRHTRTDEYGFEYRFIEWSAGIKGYTGEVQLLLSEKPGYSNVSWINADGTKMSVQVPLGNIIKLSWCDGATYIRIDDFGNLSFYDPFGIPQFSVGLHFCNGLTYSIWDQGMPLPVGLISADQETLTRIWTHPVACLDSDYGAGECWSYEDNVAR